MPGEIPNYSSFAEVPNSPIDLKDATINLDEKIQGIKDVLNRDRNTSYPEFKHGTDSIKQYADSGKEPSTLTDTKETDKPRGGSYGDLKEAGFGWPDYEIHHMPADSATELPREDGPAIVMDYKDHRQTASCGMSKEAEEYRQKQADLIKDGKFMEALQMDIDDIHDKFGDKYDKEIAEAVEYAKKLQEEGRV